jgi:hypothetical protein
MPANRPDLGGVYSWAHNFGSLGLFVRLNYVPMKAPQPSFKNWLEFQVLRSAQNLIFIQIKEIRRFSNAKRFGDQGRFGLKAVPQKQIKQIMIHSRATELTKRFNCRRRSGPFFSF